MLLPLYLRLSYLKPLWRPQQISSKRVTFTGRQRRYYTPGAHHSQTHIAIGSSGSIKLNIYSPPKPNPNNYTIIYLPHISALTPSPHSLPEALSSEEAIDILSSAAGATIVHVAYRLSARHPYPYPIHDVLTAYDWVLKHLVPNRHEQHPTPSQSASPQIQSARNPAPRIGVYGDFIGGALATMLGLTECHVGKPSIGALAVTNPILDWTFPTPHSPKPTTTNTKQPATNSTTQGSMIEPTNNPPKPLTSLRSKLFSSRESHHDPFASPLLFLRTSSNPLTDPALLAEEDSSSETDEIDEGPKRKYHFRYPPAFSLLKLRPTLILSTGSSTSFLGAQSAELAALMRRSISLHELGQGRKGMKARDDDDDEFGRVPEERFGVIGTKKARGNEGDKHDMDSAGMDLETEERIQYVEGDIDEQMNHDGELELSEQRHERLRAEMHSVGEWFRRVLS